MKNTYTEQVNKFLDVLDKDLKGASLTSVFEVDNAIWDGTTGIKIPSVTTQGNANYDRETGYAQGSVGVKWQTEVLTVDRGRRFNIDAVEGNELPFDLVASSMEYFDRNQATPERDAYRFAKLSKLAKADHIATADLKTSDAAIKAYDEFIEKAQAEGVNLSNAIMYVSAKMNTLIKNYIKPNIISSEKGKTLDRIIYTMDNGLQLVIVEDARFYNEIKLLSGATGEEDGGYVPTDTASVMNFIIVDINTPQAVVKRKVTKVIAPEVNQTHDGWSVYYREFHDMYVADEQKAKIFVHKAAAKTK